MMYEPIRERNEGNLLVAWQQITFGQEAISSLVPNGLGTFWALWALQVSRDLSRDNLWHLREILGQFTCDLGLSQIFGGPVKKYH